VKASCSMFSQILKLIPRLEFEKLVRDTGAERAAKGLSSWSQFVAMMFCQLGRAHSLREISGGLKSCEGKLAHLGIEAPARSSLSYANSHRPWQLYEQVFYQLFERVRGSVKAKHKFRFKNKLVSLDSTVIDLCVSVFDWAKFRRTKGAVKLHMVLDHDGYLPCFGVITEGKVHDVKVAHQLRFAPGTVVVDDRGYNDYRLFARWTEQEILFVTRMKDNAQYEVVEEREPPQNRGILADQTIRLSGIGAQDKWSPSVAPRRGGPSRHRRHPGVPDQSSSAWRQHGRGHLQREVADRIAVQGAQAESEDQDLHRHFGQRGQDSDLVRAHQHAPAALPATALTLWLVAIKLGRAAAHESVYSSRSSNLARSALCDPARPRRGGEPDGLGFRMIGTAYGGTNFETHVNPFKSRVNQRGFPQRTLILDSSVSIDIF